MRTSTGTRTVVPTGEVRTFAPDELIVSKTDLQGRITYVNGTFRRVSGYDESELLGRPHNVIRHPDTPRAVFRLLWDELRAGREMFAYINNLAKDGASYWVLAHVTPSRGADGGVVGYHSSRRLPEPAAVAEIEALYARLRAAESTQPTPRAALEASSTLLDHELAARGCTYDELVWQVVAGQGRAA
ncbi:MULTISPECIES: PAS domain-containing protein [Cellulomonas]|uniref:PAS domain S-box-containing protein n=1 Tax=Cellulomonas iranensis TaxID=76862 RepID=A0ABU0GMR5_9CELL|nr:MULTISPECIES: PAS domain-containing protein [Cellulomonas]MBO9569771.1 PAS domain S-box protein [Cellulomonas iranensis]MDQ0425890.1 PAS domain S-box-containing protein [Cellulomonas iranensis]TFH71860.1 PAS domain S-box protein [Cellulomonas sp. HD19AZ1]